MTSLQELQWKLLLVNDVKRELRNPFMCLRTDHFSRPSNCGDSAKTIQNFLLQPPHRFSTKHSSQWGFFSISHRYIPKVWKYVNSLRRVIGCSEKYRKKVAVICARYVIGLMLVVSLSVATTRAPSCKFVCLFFFFPFCFDKC